MYFEDQEWNEVASILNGLDKCGYLFPMIIRIPRMKLTHTYPLCNRMRYIFEKYLLQNAFGIEVLSIYYAIMRLRMDV